jgi:exonuclease VII large subunit
MSTPFPEIHEFESAMSALEQIQELAVTQRQRVNDASLRLGRAIRKQMRDKQIRYRPLQKILKTSPSLMSQKLLGFTAFVSVTEATAYADAVHHLSNQKNP